jgi:Saccharopine dehydrogenase NADP binding domain
LSGLPTVAVVGAGDVGSAVTRHLALSCDLGELWVLDLDVERARRAAEDAAAVALYTGASPRVTSRQVDVLSPDALHETLAAIGPQLVVQAATLQSWWVLTQLPKDLWRRLEVGARFGPWLPFHLVLARNVMRAVRELETRPLVVNVAFPDAVNAVLAADGLAPTCGAGNSDLLRPAIRLVAADRLGVPAGRVDLEWIGHHYHVVYYWMGLDAVEELDPQTYHLRVLLDGEDVGDRLDVRDTLAAAGRHLPPGRLIGERTAASAAKNARLLLRSGASDDHAAAPNGLVGGYDVRFEAGAASLRLPVGLTEEDGRAICERAQRGDGIESIAADGSVRFTIDAAETMRDVLDYDCDVLRPEDADARVVELRAKLSELTRAA